jgi:prepilin-type N-terminal cleavage/methylation domain-containing protein
MGKNQGYTIIEVLIAMAIFTVGFLALATLQTKSIFQIAGSRIHTEATTMAVESLERLISLPYSHTELDQENNPHRLTAGGYTIEWNIRDNVPITATKTIVIKVTGANPYAKPVTISFVKGLNP